MRDGQSSRILRLLQKHPDKDVASVDLHMAGSGKNNGYCNSLTRRISDLRAQGHNIIVSKDVTVNGQRHTWYRLITKPQQDLL